MDNSNDVYDMGEIELDYVAMWQRQAEPGYEEIKPDTPLPLLPNPPNKRAGKVRDVDNNVSGFKADRNSPIVICSRQTFPLEGNFIFKVLNPLPGTSYSWEYGMISPAREYITKVAALQ